MEFSSNVTRRVLPARGSRTQRWSIQAHQRGINVRTCYALGCESLWITDRSPLSEESREVRDWFTVNWFTAEFQSVVLNCMKRNYPLKGKISLQQCLRKSMQLIIKKIYRGKSWRKIKHEGNRKVEKHHETIRTRNKATSVSREILPFGRIRT